MRKTYKLQEVKKLFHTKTISVSFRRYGTVFRFDLKQTINVFGFSYTKVIDVLDFNINKNLPLTSVNEQKNKVILKFSKYKKLIVTYNEIDNNLNFSLITERA